MQEEKESKKTKSEILMQGYDDGLFWEYKNPYKKDTDSWADYYYGYIIGVVMPKNEEA